jgi:hypothetical protein
MAVSGLIGPAINAEVADLDNDGLVDLILASDPDNSGTPSSLDAYQSVIYRNTGRGGDRSNHWLRLRFSGIADAALIGARVEAHAVEDDRLVSMRAISPNQSYKSGSPLEVHVGLGRIERVYVDVVLPGGRAKRFGGLGADRYLDLNLTTGTAAAVPLLRTGV